MALTGKQESFARAVVELDPETGKSRSLSDAYRIAYTVAGSKPATIHDEASRVRAHPGVSQRIDELQAAEERLAARDAGSRARGVLSTLSSIAECEDQPAAARVQALKLIGQDAGLWSNKVEVELSSATSESASRGELEAVLREMLRAAPKLVEAEVVGDDEE